MGNSIWQQNEVTGTRNARQSRSHQHLLLHQTEENLMNQTKDLTYAQICCNVRPEKVNELNRCRITVGGDRQHYHYMVATRMVDLLTVRLLLNSVISTEGEKFCWLDIKKFYLCTPLKHYDYFQIDLSDFPGDVTKQYKLKELANNDIIVLVEIRWGMYGLLQAGFRVQELLEKHLNKHEYFHMDAHMETNTSHTCRRQFWDQICRRKNLLHLTLPSTKKAHVT